ncbi:hypothetical protein CC2G_013788 [Coprinopsis cinerea AmutBmut pab1-1]|nr:hypothetical protein CC2G_013788 [Coprinopsis cinerea AmutBmut pab1-1]
MPLFGSSKHKEEAPRRTDLRRDQGFTDPATTHNSANQPPLPPRHGGTGHAQPGHQAVGDTNYTGQNFGYNDNANRANYTGTAGSGPGNANIPGVPPAAHHSGGRASGAAGPTTGSGGGGAGQRMTGKVEEAIGTAFNSQSMQAKGLEKQRYVVIDIHIIPLFPPF